MTGHPRGSRDPPPRFVEASRTRVGPRPRREEASRSDCVSHQTSLVNLCVQRHPLRQSCPPPPGGRLVTRASSGTDCHTKAQSTRNTATMSTGLVRACWGLCGVGTMLAVMTARTKGRDTGTPESRKRGRTGIAPLRCVFVGCSRPLEFAPVEGVASSVGLGGVLRRSICPDHPPVGACSRCGIMAGPQYMVKVLPNGRCPDCAGTARVVIRRRPALGS